MLNQKVCTHCGTSKSPLWRKGPNMALLCNACGLYWKSHGEMRNLDLLNAQIRTPRPKKPAKEVRREPRESRLSAAASSKSWDALVLPEGGRRGNRSHPAGIPAPYADRRWQAAPIEHAIAPPPFLSSELIDRVRSLRRFTIADALNIVPASWRPSSSASSDANSAAEVDASVHAHAAAFHDSEHRSSVVTEPHSAPNNTSAASSAHPSLDVQSFASSSLSSSALPVSFAFSSQSSSLEHTESYHAVHGITPNCVMASSSATNGMAAERSTTTATSEASASINKADLNHATTDGAANVVTKTVDTRLPSSLSSSFSSSSSSSSSQSSSSHSDSHSYPASLSSSSKPPSSTASASSLQARREVPEDDVERRLRTYFTTSTPLFVRKEKIGVIWPLKQCKLPRTVPRSRWVPPLLKSVVFGNGSNHDSQQNREKPHGEGDLHANAQSKNIHTQTSSSISGSSEPSCSKPEIIDLQETSLGEEAQGGNADSMDTTFFAMHPTETNVLRIGDVAQVRQLNDERIYRVVVGGFVMDELGREGFAGNWLIPLKNVRSGIEWTTDSQGVDFIPLAAVVGIRVIGDI